MKAKKDRLKSLFVSTSKRLPPDDEKVQILYKTKEGGYGLTNGRIMNMQQVQIKAKGKDIIFFATKWTILY